MEPKKKKNPHLDLYLGFRLHCPSCCVCFSASATHHRSKFYKKRQITLLVSCSSLIFSFFFGKLTLLCVVVGDWIFSTTYKVIWQIKKTKKFGITFDHVKFTSLDAWTVQKNMDKKSTFLGFFFFPPLSSNPALPSVNSN